MYSLPINQVFENEPQLRPGQCAIQGDEWPFANEIIAGDDVDAEIFETNFRYNRHCPVIPSLPVKVQITGRKIWFNGHERKVRCIIKTWHSDDEPVEFRGWLFLWSNYEG